MKSLNELHSNGLNMMGIDNPFMGVNRALEDQRSKAAAYIFEYSKNKNIGTILTIANNYEEIIDELVNINEWDGWLVPTLEEIEPEKKKRWF